MTKQEFLDELRRMLNRELEADEVADHIRYYSSYIEDAVRSGKQEAQVLAELGDPRMIARTILEVDQQRDGQEYSGGGSVFTEQEDGAYHTEDSGSGSFRTHHFEVCGANWKVWLVLIGILALVLLILGTVFTIVWRLLPFLLAAAAVVWVYRRLRGRF